MGLFKKKNKNSDVLPENSAETQEEQKDDSKKSKDSETEVKAKVEELTPEQQKKAEKLDTVKTKISRILQSKNIEIVDENIGDEYEKMADEGSDKQKQQDYDSLKAMFGKGEKKKTEELTLTLDDFDFSYIGQYVDEYDLVHMKSIKKIKLPSKYKKLIKKVVTIAFILSIFVIAGIVGINMLKETPVYVVSVTLSQESQTYFAGEKFEDVGLYFLVKYSNGIVKEVPLNQGSRVGQTGRVNNDMEFYTYNNQDATATITFIYTELESVFTTVLNINIVSKNESGMSAFCSEGLFNLKKGDLITSKQLVLLMDYENYNSTKISFSGYNLKVSVSNDGKNYSKLDYTKDKTADIEGFKLNEDMTSNSVIRIEYTIGSDNNTKTITLDVKPGNYFVTQEIPA